MQRVYCSHCGNKIEEKEKPKMSVAFCLRCEKVTIDNNPEVVKQDERFYRNSTCCICDTKRQTECSRIFTF